MKLKPIRNDRALNRALMRIDELWGAKPGTPKGDELCDSSIGPCRGD